MISLKIKHVAVASLLCVAILAYILPKKVREEQKDLPKIEAIKNISQVPRSLRINTSHVTLPPPPSHDATKKQDGRVNSLKPLRPVQSNSQSLPKRRERLSTQKLSKSNSDAKNIANIAARSIKPLSNDNFAKHKVEPNGDIKASKKLQIKTEKPSPAETGLSAILEKKRTPTKPKLITIEADKKVTREGRVLLKLLEHGDGPAIEIAWPAARSAKNKLFDHLIKCHGMTTAIFVPKRGLFTKNSQSGNPIDLDRQNFSGFVRQSSGMIGEKEAHENNFIRRFHKLGDVGQLVRLFPRTEDARLLGGINTLSGGDYRFAKTVIGEYRLTNNAVYVDNLRIDAIKVRGRVLLASGSCA